MSYELRLPQISGGTTEEQLVSLRNYLYQTIEQLNFTLSLIEKDTELKLNELKKSSAIAKTSQSKQDSFDDIKALIIRSSDILNAYTEKITKKLEGVYVESDDYDDFVKEVTDAIGPMCAHIRAGEIEPDIYGVEIGYYDGDVFIASIKVVPGRTLFYDGDECVAMIKGGFFNFCGNVCGRVYGLGKLPKIPNGSDVNGYAEIGIFSVESDDTAKTMSNLPVQVSGVLRVFSADGTGRSVESSGTGIYLLQEYTTRDGSAVYGRAIYTDTVDENGLNVWTHGEWAVVSGRMADYVVKSYEDGAWKYDEYFSGKVVARCIAPIDVVCNTQTGFVYRTTADITSPALIKDISLESSAIVSSDGAKWMTVFSVTDEKIGVTIYSPTQDSEAHSVNISITVIGTKK